MDKKIFFLFILIIITKLYLYAQCVVVQGYVLDSLSREPLIGAYIIEKQSNYITASNESGFFKISTKSDKAVFKVSYIGYKTKETSINISDTICYILLSNNAAINEVVVSATQQKINNIYSGVEYMSAKTVNSLPVILGEPDLFKSLSLLSGISFGTENTMGYFVRGGSNSQNLILLNEIPIYNSNHLYGLFSVFNTQVINGMTLYKGSIPVQYGGKLSSVLDVRTKLGDASKLRGCISTGFINSQLTLQVPVFKGNTRIVFSARRSMFDVYPKWFTYTTSFYNGTYKAAEGINLPDYHMGDIILTIGQKLNNKNSLTFTLFSSKDEEKSNKSKQNKNINKQWNNFSSAVKWNTIWNNYLSGKTILYFSKYKSFSNISTYIGNIPQAYYSVTNGIEDISLKQDINYVFKTHNISFGIQYQYLKIYPQVENRQINNNFVTKRVVFGKTSNSNILHAYIEDNFNLTKKTQISLGIRFSTYKRNKFISSKLLPRISLNYKMNDKISLKTFFTRTMQPIHLITDTWNGSPNDSWLPANNDFMPETAWTTGIETAWQPINKLETGVGIFYKKMKNLTEYKDIYPTTTDSIVWNDIVDVGTGTAYGMEFSLKYSTAKYNLMLNYTLSKSTRQFEFINNGNPYRYFFDRRHELSLAVIYKINKNINFSLNWIYASGHPVTLTNIYQVADFGDAFMTKSANQINNYQLPDYHRLDIGMHYEKKKQKLMYYFDCGVYNAYNRQNVYYVEDSPEGLYITTMFGILPYLNLGIKF